MIVSGWELCGILCAFEHTFWGEVIKVNFETNLFTSSNNILEKDFVMEDVSTFIWNIFHNMSSCLANMHIENNEFPYLNDNLKSKGELDKEEMHYNDVVDLIQRPMEVVWN